MQRVQKIPSNIKTVTELSSYAETALEELFTISKSDSGSVAVRSEPPRSPVGGQTYYNESEDVLYIYNTITTAWMAH